jgi:hypothetical protein
MKKENKSGGHYMSVLEQGVPEIRAPSNSHLEKPLFGEHPHDLRQEYQSVLS